MAQLLKGEGKDLKSLYFDYLQGLATKCKAKTFTEGQVRFGCNLGQMIAYTYVDSKTRFTPKKDKVNFSQVDTCGMMYVEK